MKSRKQKILSFVLALIVFAGCLASPVEIKASTAIKKSVTIAKGNYFETFEVTKERVHDKKDCKVSIGNKKILSHLGTTSGGPVVMGLKKGSTTLIIQFKKGGRWKKYSIKVKVVPYESPVKSLKIGSKTLTSRLKKADSKRSQVILKPKTKKEKISVKPASGWKVKSIEWYPDYEVKLKKIIKNNKKITYDGDSGMLTLTLYKKKTKQVERLNIDVLETPK